MPKIMRRSRIVTERIWIVTGEWPDGRSPLVCRISAPQDVDDADRLAENILAAGAVRVTVEPFRVKCDEDHTRAA